MKRYVVSSILKNVNWGKMYDVSASKYISGTTIAAEEGGHYIFDDCGNLVSATKEEYDAFNNGRKDIAYRLTEDQTINVFSELMSMLEDLRNCDPEYVFVIAPGVVNHDSEKTAFLHSFIIEKVMTINEFVRYFSTTMLEEYDKFVRNDCITDRIAREYFLNHFYFPMKKKKKALVKKVIELKPADVDLDHAAELTMEELEKLCEIDDDTNDWM